jgi:hypothetical protein
MWQRPDTWKKKGYRHACRWLSLNILVLSRQCQGNHVAALIRIISVVY